MAQNDANHQLHVLGAFVHGALCALHGLGILYNLRRKNRGDAIIHAAALIYDARAVRHHYLEATSTPSR